MTLSRDYFNRRNDDCYQRSRNTCNLCQRCDWFPEIMDGRVKTLNPKIHGGILAVRSNPEHMAALEKHDIKPIDLVVVNLYPLKKQLLNQTLQRQKR